MAKSSVPIGWPLLPVPDSSGKLAYPADLDSSVRESIRLILSTRPGELLFHPEFGAGLDRFLNDLDSLGLRQRIHDSIMENLARWEPRIDVERVDVNEVPNQPSRLRIQIAYRLRRTGSAGSVALTLAGGA